MKTLNFEPDVFAIIRPNIKRYHKQQKMTSEQLAELVDLSHDFIRQVESGKYHFSVETLYRISVALDVGIPKREIEALARCLLPRDSKAL